MLDAIFAQPKRVAAQLGLTPSKVASLRDVSVPKRGWHLSSAAAALAMLCHSSSAIHLGARAAAYPHDCVQVPGAPRSIIPGLARAGVEVLSIGVNDYAPSPQIPTPCVWTEPSTGESIVLLMTAQGVGYPDNAGSSPTQPGGLGVRSCVSHPASPAVLCWAFRTDNSGPPTSVAEVLDQYEIAKWQWPGGTVVASTFDAWWEEFKAVVPQLPVVTQEAGETWLTGFAADPPKNAFYRTAAREYAQCKAAGACDDADPRIYNFLRMLMKMPEHTWGLPSIYDDANYTVSGRQLRLLPAPLVSACLGTPGLHADLCRAPLFPLPARRMRNSTPPALRATPRTSTRSCHGRSSAPLARCTPCRHWWTTPYARRSRRRPRC